MICVCQLVFGDIYLLFTSKPRFKQIIFASPEWEVLFLWATESWVGNQELKSERFFFKDSTSVWFSPRMLSGARFSELQRAFSVWCSFLTFRIVIPAKIIFPQSEWMFTLCWFLSDTSSSNVPSCQRVIPTSKAHWGGSGFMWHICWNNSL